MHVGPTYINCEHPSQLRLYHDVITGKTAAERIVDINHLCRSAQQSILKTQSGK